LNHSEKSTPLLENPRGTFLTSLAISHAVVLEKKRQVPQPINRKH